MEEWSPLMSSNKGTNALSDTTSVCPFLIIVIGSPTWASVSSGVDFPPTLLNDQGLG